MRVSLCLMALLLCAGLAHSDEVAKQPPHSILRRMPPTAVVAALGSTTSLSGPHALLAASIFHPAADDLRAWEVILSPDSKQALIMPRGSEDLLLYDAVEGKLITRLTARYHGGAGFLPDNSRICWVEYDPPLKGQKRAEWTRQLVIHDRSGKKPAVKHALLPGQFPGGPLAFSPSGKRVAGHSNGVVAFDLETGQEVGHCPSALTTEKLIFMNETILAGVARHTGGSLWDLEAGGRLEVMGDAGDLAATSDRKLLAFFNQTEIVLWNGKEGKAARRFGLGGHVSVAFSPDDRLLAAFTSPGLKSNVSLFETATGKEAAVFPRGGNPVANLTFSPNGKKLAWATEVPTVADDPDRRAQNSYIVLADIGDRKRTLRFRHGPTEWTRFLPEVRHLAFAADNRTLWVFDEWGVVTLYRLE